MKKILFVLLFGMATTSIHAQSVEDDDFLLTVVKSLYIKDFHLLDTSKLWIVQFGVGSNYLRKNTSIYDNFLSGLQYDIKLLFRFNKKPGLIDAAIGIQYSEHSFNMIDQYANISTTGITFEPNVYSNTNFNRVKIRSINFPIMLYALNRKIRFLNKFKLGMGVVPGINFKKGIQKTIYEIDDEEHTLKEVSDFNLPRFRGGILFELYFNNLFLYYEYGINIGAASKNFTNGINKVGLGFAF
ncbi:hypothetical protein OAK92_01500 [Crocinitomicaceae bacterium]|nr:hypothetical protein [Crocinitomicaceae bacterium]